MLKGRETFGRFTIANEGVDGRNKDYSRRSVCVSEVSSSSLNMACSFSCKLESVDVITYSNHVLENKQVRHNIIVSVNSNESSGVNQSINQSINLPVQV
jgi:hypothetical protein